MVNKLVKERFFSLELNSRSNLSSMTLSNDGREGTLISGTIGALISAGFIEGVVLAITGEKGVIRVDLNQDEVASINEASKEVSA